MRGLPAGAVWAAWLATRAGLYLIAMAPGQGGDVGIYQRWYGCCFAHGTYPLADPLWQYPPGAALVFWLPGHLPGGYLSSFVLLMLACDLAITCLLRGVGRWYWVCGVPLLGTITVTRFDMVPVMLSVAALCVTGRGILRGALAGAGAAIKAWPLTLLAGLAPGQGRRGLAAAAAVLAAVAVVFATETAGFLTDQNARGVEIESIAATPLMIWRQAGWSGTVVYRFGAWQLSGPYVALAHDASRLGLVLAVAAVLGWRLLLTSGRAAWRPEFAADAPLAATLLALVASPVLSAQYLLWPTGLAAACLAAPRTTQRSVALAVLAADGLTQLIFPFGWGPLLHGSDLVTGVLTARNVVLAAAAALSCWRIAALSLPSRRAAGSVPLRAEAPLAAVSRADPALRARTAGGGHGVEQFPQGGVPVSRRPLGALRGRRPGLAPVEDEVAFSEQPRAVDLDEGVEVAQRGDHDLALAVGGEQVMRDRVAFAGGPLAVEHHGALPVEMSRRLVLVQGLEDGRECLTAFEDVGRLRVRAAHVDGEASAGREQGLLPLGVAPVGAVRVSIEQLADGETVRGLGGTDLGVNSHERLSGELRGRPGGLVRNMGASSGEFPGGAHNNRGTPRLASWSPGVAGATWRRRSDATQNREAILAAALAALTESSEVSLNAIAKRAGVANATLYRHFPTRESLVLEVYRHEVRQLVAAADQLLAEREPGDALREWVTRLAQYAMTKHGLAQAIRAAASPGSTLFEETYSPIVAALGRMLAAAEQAGVVRAGLNPDDVILALAGLWEIDPATDWKARAHTLYDIVFTGLKA